VVVVVDVVVVVGGRVVVVLVDVVVVVGGPVVVVDTALQGLCAQEPGPMDVPPTREQCVSVSCPQSSWPLPLFSGMQQRTLSRGPLAAAASVGTNATVASTASAAIA